MATPTYTLYFNDAFNYSWINIKDEMVEQAYTYPVGWNQVLKNVKMNHEGGEVFIVPQTYGKNGTVKWHTHDRQAVPLNSNSLTVDTYFKMKRVTVTLERLAKKEMNAYGNAAAEKRYVSNVLQKGMTDLVDELETVMASDSSYNSDAPPGFLEYLRESPTASATVAGLDQSDSEYDFWRNDSIDMTGVAPAGNLERNLRIQWKTVGKKTAALRGTSRQPTVGLLGEDAHTAYEDEVDDRVQHTTAAETSGGPAGLGFEDSLKFKRMFLHYCPSLPDDYALMLNENLIEFRVHPLEDFTMTDWKPVADRANDFYAQMALSCMIVFYDRSRMGLIHSIGQAT